MKFPNCSQLLPFLRIGFFTSSTFSGVRLIEGCPWHLASSTEVTPLSNLTEKLVFFHCLLSKSLFQHFESFCTIFPYLKTKSNAEHVVLSSLPFSRHTQITNGTTHTCNEQDITQQSHMLQPYCMQELTLQTPGTNSSVITLPVITLCIPDSHTLFLYFQHQVIL